MLKKQYGICLLLAALWLISLGAGSAYAYYEWTEDWLSGSLSPNWTESFPQTSDGYIADTGLDNSTLLEFGTWFDGVRGDLVLSDVSGATGTNRHLWNITRDASGIGTKDFRVQMEVMIFRCGPDKGDIDLKLVDSSGYVIAGAYMIDPSPSYNRCDLGYVANLDASSAAPRDARDPSSTYQAVQIRPASPAWVTYYTLMELVRDASGNCTFNFGCSPTGASGTYTTYLTYDMGQATGSVEDLQISMGWTDTSRAYRWWVGPISVSSGEPFPGDTDKNGVVDETDAATLAANWLAGSATWAMGDFNNDQIVDDKDATLMATNWHYGMAASASVPEPSVAVLLCALFALFALRRRSG